MVALRNALRTFPYKEAMQRIKGQEPEHRRRGFRILGILAHARRSLGLEELKHALAVLTIEEEGYSEDNLEKAINKTKTILGSTSSLIIVKANQANLVHSSLEEYLRREANSTTWLPNADFDLARAYMLYLQLVLPSRYCQDDY